MSKLHNNTAILVFSRSAQAESREKKLAFDARKAAHVVQLMIDHTRKIVQSTELPYFFLTEKQQVGSNFGERIANAFDTVFAKGFTNVIAIGNDCLTLSETDILTAAQALKTTPSVLGATTDGGAYLIGLDKSAFQKTAFQNIEWQTSLTFSNIVQFIDNQELTTFFLSPKSDIDHVFDWRKTLQSVSTTLRKKLLQLLNIALPTPSAQAFLPINDRFLGASIALRAPPFSF